MESSTPTSSSTALRIAIFFSIIFWHRRREKRKQKHLSQIDCFSNEKCEGDNNEKFLHDLKNVGPRGTASIKQAVSYWDGFLNCLQNPCDPISNPNGYIALCLAENKLVQEALALRLMQSGTVVSAFSDSIVYCYNGFLGLPHVREVVARFLERRFVKPNIRNNINNTSVPLPTPEITPDDTIDPNHIAIGSGCGSLLSHLFFILASPGEAVLIPSPYYQGFEYDIRAIAGCVPYPIHVQNLTKGPTINDLDKAFHSARKEGLSVKILLLTNPNDPLGIIYPPNVLLQTIRWARSHKLHTIVDEVYALSVHKENCNFQSVLRVLKKKLEHDVHFVWGLSKDFGASGFRMAMLYSQNRTLLQALANLNIFSGVSHPVQIIIAEILSDDQFIDAFLEDARKQLSWSYNICTTKLDEMVVPYIEADAGLFVYVDFSSLLPEQTFLGEKRFAALVQDVARVVMTPGQIHRDKKPGMFRICYSWVPPDVLQIAMERLSYLVLQLRRNNWDDLDTEMFSDIMKTPTRRALRRMQSIQLTDHFN